MRIRNVPSTASLSVAASLTVITSPDTPRAVALLPTFAETTDAGQILLTADAPASGFSPAGTSLSTIYGTFSGSNGADLLATRIATLPTFSTSTVDTMTNAGGQDTALFLFSSTGTAVASNDDAAGGTAIASALPSGDALHADLTSALGSLRRFHLPASARGLM